MVGQVKAYVEMTPEERKVKNEELKDKTNDIANKVADSTKGLFGNLYKESPFEFILK